MFWALEIHQWTKYKSLLSWSFKLGEEREKERNPNSNKKELEWILGETGLSEYENSTIFAAFL